MTLYISLIVEGHSEAGGAAKSLLERVCRVLLGGEPIRLKVLPPSRCQRDAFIKPNHPAFASKVEEAALKLAQCVRRDPQGCGLLLMLLDAEKDCPAQLGPKLEREARVVRGDFDIACVLAKHMFENWIVAGASTLAGVNGLPDWLPERPTPENGSGANWLERQIRNKNKARTYKKTVDAKEFVAAMDLSECRDNSRSFRKFLKELEARLPPPPPPDPPPAETPAE